MTRTLLLALTLLLAADCVLTTIAVGQLGATELNPICGGVEVFIVFKLVVSAVAVGMFVYLGDFAPRMSLACIGVLSLLYGGALACNLGAFLNA